MMPDHPKNATVDSKMSKSFEELFEEQLQKINAKIREEQERFIHRPMNKACDHLEISHSLKVDTLSLGEIFAKCKEFPEDSVFIVLFYYTDKKRFWCPDELIIKFEAHREDRTLYAYSGYYKEHPKDNIITNTRFLKTCDPEKTGKVDCIGWKNPLWIIDDNTPVKIRTKNYYDLPINDVIHFDDNGVNYIALIVNGKYD